jgi:hypothetical protein
VCNSNTGNEAYGEPIPPLLISALPSLRLRQYWSFVGRACYNVEKKLRAEVDEGKGPLKVLVETRKRN